MTLSEAIKHERIEAEDNYQLAAAYHDDYGVYSAKENYCRERAEYHEQIAEWLEELIDLKSYDDIDAIRKHIDMFFRLWYEKDIDFGTYEENEIQEIVRDFAEQIYVKIKGASE